MFRQLTRNSWLAHAAPESMVAKLAVNVLERLKVPFWDQLTPALNENPVPS